MSNENMIKTTLESVQGIVEAVPIYQDAVQPAAKEVGKSLNTVAKAVNMALAPLSALVWGYEKIADYVTKRVSEMLENVPQERIVIPNASVAGPVIESLRFSGNEPDLREMYARLLATAMDENSAKRAHPAFVETIKQLCSDEAKIIRILADERYRPKPIVFLETKLTEPDFERPGYLTIERNISLLPQVADCLHKELAASYIDNLHRLGLIEIRETSLISDELYEELEKLPVVQEHMAKSMNSLKPKIKRGYIKITDFGQQFIDACIGTEPHY